MPLTVAALYKFVALPDVAGAAGPPARPCAQELGITGTLLLAPEGINGTVAGPAPAIEALPGGAPHRARSSAAACADLDCKLLAGRGAAVPRSSRSG